MHKKETQKYKIESQRPKSTSKEPKINSQSHQNLFPEVEKSTLRGPKSTSEAHSHYRLPEAQNRPSEGQNQLPVA